MEEEIEVTYTMAIVVNVGREDKDGKASFRVRHVLQRRNAAGLLTEGERADICNVAAHHLIAMSFEAYGKTGNRKQKGSKR